MVKIKAKIFKLGNTFAVRIPKALIDTEVLRQDTLYTFELNSNDTMGALYTLADNFAVSAT